LNCSKDSATQNKIYTFFKFGPWGFCIHMYEIKRMEDKNGHAVKFGTYI